MFSRTRTTQSTKSSSREIERFRRILEDADAVLIGAGAGLSASAGFVYTGARFERYFSDFAARYGFRDMYSGGFYPFPEPEIFWAYWSRYIYVNRCLPPPKPIYETLEKLVRDKDCFVLTTNVDHCFQRAGFDKTRLFYTQGDYGLFQCSEPCCQETFENEALVRQMVERQENMRIPSELVPRCPRCGKPAAMNLRSDGTFVQDAGWHAAAERYGEYLRRHREGSVLYLELGVGGNTPGIIKYPFWMRTLQNPGAFYVCVNQGQAYAPHALEGRSLCLNTDIGELLNALCSQDLSP